MNIEQILIKFIPHYTIVKQCSARVPQKINLLYFRVLTATSKLMSLISVSVCVSSINSPLFVLTQDSTVQCVLRYPITSGLAAH